MTQRRFDYQVLDVFTTEPLKGNPLAVFPSGEGLSAAQMQQIAAEFNLSETVFLLPAAREGAVAKARIFTPKREVDFAGHPTVGSAFVLSRQHGLEQPFVIEENVGAVSIEPDRDEHGFERFWLTTPKIEFSQTLDAQLCASLVHLPLEDLLSDVPPQFVSAGNPMLYIAVNTPEAVDRAALQESYLPAVLDLQDAVGTFVFARKEPASATNYDVYSRMFAPQSGIREDPATGSATGPLAAYMLKYGLLPRDAAVRFISEQGAHMGRRSILHVRVDGADSREPVIRVGGCAVLVAQGTFFVD